MQCRVVDAPLLGFRLAQFEPETRDIRFPASRVVQEALLFTDSLRILCGAQGSYLRVADYGLPFQGPNFAVASGCDTALRDAVAPVLAMAAHHAAIREYAAHLSSLEVGRVNQALGAALRKLSQDLVSLCADMERQPELQPEFNLQTMLILLHPTAKLMEQAYELVQELQGTHYEGGAVLGAVSRRLQRLRGHPVARDLLTTVLDRASDPFLDMLRRWIHHGEIQDLFNEFAVKENPEKDSLDLVDEYWEQRYTVIHELLPLELSSPTVYNQILLAGKYLNVVRECSTLSLDNSPEGAGKSVRDPTLISEIATAYQFANDRLLKVFTELSLNQRLVEFKHTFFLDNSDFLPTFLETAHRELAKPASSASIQKLQYALDMAIQQPGSISSEQHLDALKVSLASTNLFDELLTIANVSGVTVEQLEAMGDGMFPEKDREIVTSSSLNALTALQLDFEINFPLTLVISRSSVFRYQFLFRLLLLIKTIIKGLDDAWKYQMRSAVWSWKTLNTELQKYKTKANILRARMLTVMQTLLYYCCCSVIETNWKQFTREIHQCKTVESLRDYHLTFLDKCLKECLLTRPSLLHTQAKLFKTARMYVEFLQSHDLTLAWIDPSMLSEQEQLELEPMLSSKGVQYAPEELMQFFGSTVEQYELSFNKYFTNLVEEVASVGSQENAVLRSLLTRIDDPTMNSLL